MDINEIKKRLELNPDDYNQYIALGDYYYNANINQAYLCYEHAFCNMNNDNKEIIKKKMDLCREQDGFYVSPLSFVILSYNCYEIMKECLNAIRDNCDKGTYEVIVVDNSSNDGIQDWLAEQTDIKLALNTDNVGFSRGCNQGIEMADSKNDILLLNNDAIVTKHSIFYLRLGLYKNEKIGTAGPISSNVILSQQYDGTVRTKEEWLELAKTINVPLKNDVQYAHWLQGHALLIKRSVLNIIGGLDTRYEYGNAEDDDYGITVNSYGYKCAICKNSFVYHYGSASMGKDKKRQNNARHSNSLLLNEKWGFNWNKYNKTHYGLIKNIKDDFEKPIKVLCINDGFSNIMNVLQYRYPNASIYAIDKDEKIVKIASSYLNIICGDIETMAIPYEKEFFDYIILNNTVEYLYNPIKTLKMIREYLKQDGYIIATTKNANHISVIMELIRGKNVTSIGTIIDKSSIRSYTMNDFSDLLIKSGYKPKLWSYLFSPYVRKCNEDENKLIQDIKNYKNCLKENDYLSDNLLIKASKQ